MENLLKILVVEDSEQIIELIKLTLQNIKDTVQVEFEVEVAKSTVEVEKLLTVDKFDFDIVLMDGCLGSSEPNTLKFVTIIKNDLKFAGPLVAISGFYNTDLMEVGCTQEWPKDKVKTELPSIIFDILIKKETG